MGMRKKHNGIRPQDIVVLLKIVLKGNEIWYSNEIAHSLGLSGSTVFDSLERSIYATLISGDKKRVNKKGLYELLIYSLKYIFPVQPQALVKGIATAHSYEVFKTEFSSNVEYVWKHNEGDIVGQEIEPLYENQMKAALKDPQLYRVLALIDLLRIGNKREIAFAQKELKQIILV